MGQFKMIILEKMAKPVEFGTGIVVTNATKIRTRIISSGKTNPADAGEKRDRMVIGEVHRLPTHGTSRPPEQCDGPYPLVLSGISMWVASSPSGRM